MTTFMPASRRRRASPRPMPLDAPVTYATLPARSFSGAGCEAPTSASAATARAPGGEPSAPAAAATAAPARKRRRPFGAPSSRDVCLRPAMVSPSELELHVGILGHTEVVPLGEPDP